MAMMLCSSDSHTYEPADLWTSRLPKNLRHAALHWQYIDGGPRGALTNAASAKTSAEDAKGYITISRPLGAKNQPMEGGIDERVAALDKDGVHKEVMLANIGMGIFNTADAELSQAHATIYNDYMGETFAKRPDRFIPLAAVPLHDIDWAVEEIDRAAKMGLRGAMLPIVVQQSYALPMYEPIWSSLQDHGMPATFHAATGFDEKGSGIERQVSMKAMMAPSEPERLAARCLSGVEYAFNAQNLISTLVGAGICARYPRLMFVSAENHAYWLAGLMGAMDHAFTPMVGKKPALMGMWNADAAPDDQPMMREFTDIIGKWPYDLRPSEYVRRQIRCTFMDDRMAIACRNITGVETLMWAADFPHPESTYPDSRMIVEDLFAGVPQDERDAIVAGNLAKLYGFETHKAA